MRQWMMGTLTVVAWTLLQGCASPSSETSGAWQVPAADQGHYNRILIVALAPNLRSRVAFEETVVAHLGRGAVSRGIASHGLGPDMDVAVITPAAIQARVAALGADAVLVTRIAGQSAAADRKPEELVQHGAGVQVSQSEDESMTVVIASNRTTEVRAGQEMMKVSNQLRTALYSTAAGERPVYLASTSASFELAADAPVEMAAASFAEVLVAELRRDGVIR